MAWAAPRTWVTGELVTAVLMNEQVRDNLLAMSVINDFLSTPLGASPGAVYAQNVAGDGSATLTTDLLVYTPMFVVAPTVVTELGVYLTLAAASSNVRLGLYTDTGNGRPSTLIVDGGTVATTAGAGTGKSVVFAATTIANPGTIWTAVVKQGVGVPQFGNGGGYTPIGDTTLEPQTQIRAYGQAAVSGALPASVGALTATSNRVGVYVVNQ